MQKLLHEYHVDSHNPAPDQVARLDEAYRGIKRIVDHKFSHPRKFKSDLQLLILWDDEKEPRRSSWSKSLGEEEAARKRLNDNFMARFTPRKSTWNKDHPNYEPLAWLSRRRKAN